MLFSFFSLLTEASYQNEDMFFFFNLAEQHEKKQEYLLAHQLYKKSHELGYDEASKKADEMWLKYEIYCETVGLR